MKYTTEWLFENVFDNRTNSYKLHRQFIDVSDGNEWGVDVQNLDEVKDEHSQVSFRISNPMHDEDWTIGNPDDLADALNEAAYMWQEFNRPLYG